MPNVYLGTTPISVGELGTTNVTKIYLGTTLVWPTTPTEYHSYVNDFTTLDISDFNNVTGVAPVLSSGMVRCNATNGDTDLWLKLPMSGDDMVVRFTLGSTTSGTNAWYAAPMMRGTSTGSDRIGANFATNAVFFQRWENSGSDIEDWAGINGSTSANLAAQSIIEISCISNNYYVVYETSAGVRTTPITTADPYIDSVNEYPIDSTHRYAGFRVGRGSSRNSVPCDKFEAYDMAYWPIHLGLTKNGTQATASLGTYQRVTGHISRVGYPHSLPASNIITMRGSGTVNIDARVQMSSGTSRTQQARLVKNGSTVVWESSVTSSGTTAIAMPTQSVSVVTGDYFELQHKLVSGSSTTIAAGAAVTYLYSTPTAPGA